MPDNPLPGESPLPGECHLKSHVDDFVRKSQSLAVSVRTLRKEFAKCTKCERYPDCELRSQFKDRIRAAVSDLTEEWNLAESF